MRVGHLVVLLALLLLVARVMRVIERAVVVLVAVVVRLVLERAEHLAALVMVRDVVVVVGMRDRLVDVLVLRVADDALFDLLHAAPPAVDPASIMPSE